MKLSIGSTKMRKKRSEGKCIRLATSLLGPQCLRWFAVVVTIATKEQLGAKMCGDFPCSVLGR